MKYITKLDRELAARVAPHWGAWIEISWSSNNTSISTVAPHWGAWIEIMLTDVSPLLPTVAPHWGAWIEISSNRSTVYALVRRTPLGCVD